MILPVIIPFYKNTEQLDKCQLCLSEQTLKPTNIFIHDNSIENIYFTKAINIGLRKFINFQDCNYIIILNQDMYLEPDAIEEMVKFMDSNERCGIGMPLQLSCLDSNNVIFGGGIELFPVGSAMVGELCLFKNNQKIHWADGGCLILRRKMIQEIGLLDENMRLVGSDSDYCFTARSRGWQVWNIVKAKGIHERGSAAEQSNSLELSMVKATDMDYFSAKWITGGLYRELCHPDDKYDPESINSEIENIKKVESMIRKEIERASCGLDTANISGI